MAPQSTTTTNPENEELPSDRIYARMLATPEPGEEVVISGIAGCFPDSNDVLHFMENLFNKVDMVSGDSRRWEPIYPEIPQRTGKLHDITKFDPGFFGIHYRQANSADPMVRIFMEKAIEAIIDAGINPGELEGTNTGVFVGSCFSESEKSWFFDHLEPQQFGLTGCMRCMIPNRLSYYLKLDGLSHITDTACSSSLYALENAYRAIRSGACESAIVGGTNLTLHPFVSLQFARLGVLSPDGACKSFDDAGNGYARSEAVCAIVLQKAKHAKRNYGQLVHVKSNCDGYKEQGITYPSGEMQKRLLQEFYDECGVDPASLSFLEAHGTGTKVGDPEEVAAIDEVFMKNRTVPLLMGSVKSNIGHSEPASGLCSVAKCVIGMETGYIPPNIHYSKPREGVEALEEGRVKVVTEKHPFEDDRGLVGINSFGFGGGNCHVLLKWNTKEKVDQGQPKDEIPRLVCVSGRTEESVNTLLDDFNSRKLDGEHASLLQQVFRKNIPTHVYRGYTITSKLGKQLSSLSKCSNRDAPLYLAFSNFDATWQSIANHLLTIPLFAATLQKIHNILSRRGMNITDAILENNSSIQKVHNFILGNLTVQIGVVDILRHLNLKIDYVFGYTLGELVCAYVDDSLSLEQVILSAFEIANYISEISYSSLTYNIHISENEIKGLLPKGVEIIGKNAESVVTVSGVAKAITPFIEDLKKNGIDVTEINSSYVTLHSKNIARLEKSLVEKLRKVINEPKQRSNMWISTSTEKVASPEYFVKAMHSVISFDELTNRIPKNSVILEVGTGYFEKLLKPTLHRSVETIAFQLAPHKSNVTVLLEVIGQLYNSGFNPDVSNLYPKVQYPVSRGTPMIAPKVKWDHSLDWSVTYYTHQESLKSGTRVLGVATKEEDWKFLPGHTIDGRQLFPATGYLYIVWETLSVAKYMLMEEMQIVFENCRFNRATNINKEITEFTIMIQPGSGNFEVMQGGADVMSGRITMPPEFANKKEQFNLPIPATPLAGEEFTLTTKDIYKELRLRGYNYRGAFRAIKECNQQATRGLIKWDGNWIAFIDNMLQMKILQVDTRLLYVPTSIKRISIDAKRHLAYVSTFEDEEPLLPVYVYESLGIIKCGGIEIRGLNASSIARRKQFGEPVLEKYEFVPNETNLTIAQSVRVNMQVGLENHPAIKIKAVELVDEATVEDSELLGPIIHEVLSDQPLIQPTIIILSKTPMELSNVTVEDKKLVAESDCMYVVGSKLLERSVVLHQALGALKEKGFLISREDLTFDHHNAAIEDLEILTVHTTDKEKLLLIRKSTEYKAPISVNVSLADNDFNWVNTLKSSLKNDGHVVVYSQNETLNGTLGMFNCLKREAGSSNLKCVITFGNAPPFDVSNPFYENQLKKNLSINIFKDGQWGTYRHLLMNKLEEIETEHCYANVTVRGDLSSLRWIEGPLTSQTILPPEKRLVNIYYASLNFRDVMTASGRINADVITMDRTEQECVQGFEFSGRDQNGKRVFGMVTHGALASMLAADNYLLWPVPDYWTLEDAATIPVVYGTVLYALLIVSKIKKGDAVLIHSGTGGIGQAAVGLALHYGCTVFTTVGSQEKRDFLKKRYPQLTDRNIGSSRDLTFEKLVKKETNGRGVDIVLNSLAEEKLQASIRCLARGGRFVEIGKFDLANNTKLNLMLMEKEASFHGVMLDQFFTSHPNGKKQVGVLINQGIATGAIRPLTRILFKQDEVEQAFRHMATGKHTGKVMIQVRKEEPEKVCIAPIKLYKARPRYACSSEKCYIITGGLGGFGLELADWLVLRGARRLVLTSRSGIKTGYQALRIRIWKTYGAFIHVSTANITTKEGCVKLIKEAEEIGEIESIFNLAVVLKDALFENQTPENFITAFGPKAAATKYLDEVTREMCPNLRDFVVFSSVSCGRGNPGQTNYGMANSVMERICEQRKQDGFPALAIQWGAIGDVGLVAEMQEEHTEMEIGGTLQQRISSCLQVMDMFLRQKQAPIVSSMVVAEKRGGLGGAENIVEAVANILGLKKETVSPHATLAELGMDSMTAVEIKQILEREFEVFLTAQDIRSMTFARLQEIQNEKLLENETGVVKQRIPTGVELIFRYLGKETTSSIPLIHLPSKVEDADVKIFCFPGIEGFAAPLSPLANNLNAKVIGIQFCYTHPTQSYLEIAKESAEKIERNLSVSDPLHIVTYSWGTIIGLEALAILEAKGYVGTITCIDGAPEMLCEMARQQMKFASEAEFETIVMVHLMGLYIPHDIILSIREKLYLAKNLEERMKIAEHVVPKDAPHTADYQRHVCIGLVTRMKELQTYKRNYDRIKSVIRLFKPTTLSVQNVPDDYKLSELCNDPVEVKVFEGNHISIIENSAIAEEINSILGCGTVEEIEPKEQLISNLEPVVNHQTEVKQI